jgi:RNA polymerase sigma-70 factor (ECF subfamily)
VTAATEPGPTGSAGTGAQPGEAGAAGEAEAGAAAGRPDFTAATEPFRRELLAHCYRLVGSVDEAEDLVQEAYLRAWRAWGRFEGRSSVRTWLYRIATNTCLNGLRGRGRRPLPSGIGAPSDDPGAPPDGPPPRGLGAWVQPLPDALVTPAADDPAAVVAARADLRLSLVAGLQLLPPRQRAVLILREVLAFPAADVASMLDTSVAAVKSSLQRARARLDQVAASPAGDGPDVIAEPTDPDAVRLLDRYVTAFETSDVDLLEAALRDDAALEMVPSPTWFAGKATCVPYLATVMGSPGDWRMARTTANGQPATATWHRRPDGGYEPFGAAVLTVTPTGIRRIVAVGDPTLVARLGHPVPPPR